MDNRMKLTVKKPAESKPLVSVADMQPGQAGILRNNKSATADVLRMYKGHVVLRTYDEIVSLHDPAANWDDLKDCGWWAELLPPGTLLTMTLPET